MTINMNKVWEIATARAAHMSERYGKVRVGLKWKNQTINKGVKRYPQEFLAYAFDEVAYDMEKDAETEEKEKENLAIKKQSEEKAKNSKNGRYITTLDIAERDGLHHGSSWYATQRDIDLGGSPEWEDEIICYVYPREK